MRFVLPGWQPYTDPDRRYAKARACMIDNMVQKMETEMRRQEHAMDEKIAILHAKMKGSTDCQSEVEVDTIVGAFKYLPNSSPFAGNKENRVSAPVIKTQAQLPINDSSATRISLYRKQSECSRAAPPEKVRFRKARK
mmetsp:Transcript_18334/g.44153  ORF Transcript_18334/g.44153 Transcript_18334/m.44153 type:complete len:138 (+) Transcript_18334:1685-2098(+)